MNIIHMAGLRLVAPQTAVDEEMIIVAELIIVQFLIVNMVPKLSFRIEVYLGYKLQLTKKVGC